MDLVRTVNIGIAGRVSRRQEDELEEGALVERFNQFADALVEAFPDLAQVADGDVAPEDLRKQSLLGSTTMLRVLAGVYHQLGSKGYSDDEIIELFSRLAPSMSAPIATGSPWLTIRTRAFAEGATAPTARRQDLQNLIDEITEWVDESRRPTWLTP